VPHPAFGPGAEILPRPIAQEHVGPALTAGLASVAAAQPDDPVDYLAHWLLKYLAVEEQKVLYPYTPTFQPWTLEPES